MAFTIPNIGFRLTPEEAGGMPDLQSALQKGFKTFSEGQEASYKPKNLAEGLLSAQLANKLNTVKAKYAEPMAQLGLQSLQANIQKSLRPEKLTGKLANLMALRNSLPEGHPDRQFVDEAIANYSKGTNGITVLDPKTGLPMVQIGGTGGGGRSSGGKIFQTAEGDIVQQPTNTLATKLQSRITGHRIIEPYLNNIISTLPQFQSGWNKLGATLGGYANRWAGANFESPSQLQEGKASLGLAAEGMLNQFGLNGTAHNLKRMEQILTPGEDESGEGYKKRATKQLQEFVDQEKKVQGFAGTGVPLGQGNNANTGNAKGSLTLELPALGEGVSNDLPPKGAKWGYIKDPNSGEEVRLPIPRGEVDEFIKDGGRVSG